MEQPVFALLAYMMGTIRCMVILCVNGQMDMKVVFFVGVNKRSRNVY